MWRDQLLCLAAVLSAALNPSCGPSDGLTASAPAPVAIEADAPLQTDPAVAFAAAAHRTLMPPEVFPATASVRRGALRRLEFTVVNHMDHEVELGSPGTSCGCVEILGGGQAVPAFGAVDFVVQVQPRTNAILDYFTVPWTDAELGEEGQLHVEIKIKG